MGKYTTDEEVNIFLKDTDFSVNNGKITIKNVPSAKDYQGTEEELRKLDIMIKIYYTTIENLMLREIVGGRDVTTGEYCNIHITCIEKSKKIPIILAMKKEIDEVFAKMEDLSKLPDLARFPSDYLPNKIEEEFKTRVFKLQ